MASIPYERQKQQRHAATARQTWISDTAAEGMYTPGPAALGPAARRPLAQGAVNIPVGGASTSLARVDPPHAWARAPERAAHIATIESQNMGPGRYLSQNALGSV